MKNKAIIAHGKNAVTTVIAALVLFSCTSGLETSITESLPASELEKLDIEQAKLYDKLQNVLSQKSKNELLEFVDVTYANYFDFVNEVDEKLEVWEKEAHNKWKNEHSAAFKAIDECYQKWVEWERTNSLDAKIEFKLRKIHIPETTYGSLSIDFDLVSHIGNLKRAYIDFGFDTPQNTKKNKTDEFSVSVILGNHILADAPVGANFSFNNASVYNLTPEYLIGMSSDEILNKYKLLTKVSSVILEDGTEIYSRSHLRHIPPPFVDLWKKEKKLLITYKEIEGFYDNEAVKIASLTGVSYQPQTQYIKDEIFKKMTAINAALVSIYCELAYF